MVYIYSPQNRFATGGLDRLRRIDRSPGGPSATRVLSDDPLAEEFRASEASDLGKTAAARNEPNQPENYYTSPDDDLNAREAVHHAHEIMSTRVITMFLESTIEEAYHEFQRYDFQVMPVIGQNRQLVGTVARKEIYQAMLTKDNRHKTLQQLLVEKRQEVVVAEAATDIRRIASVMAEKKADALPIVGSGGTLVGIVSRTDILNCLKKDPPLSLWC